MTDETVDRIICLLDQNQLGVTWSQLQTEDKDRFVKKLTQIIDEALETERLLCEPDE